MSSESGAVSSMIGQYPTSPYQPRHHLRCRRDVMLGQYAKVVEMEAACMHDMIQQHVLPSALRVQRVVRSSTLCDCYVIAM